MFLAEESDPEENLERARELLELSITEDSKNPVTPVRLAALYVARCETGAFDCSELMERGLQSVEEALEINPDLPVAHAYKGIVHTLGTERGLDGASAEIAREAFALATADRDDLARQHDKWIARSNRLLN